MRVNNMQGRIQKIELRGGGGGGGGGGRAGISGGVTDGPACWALARPVNNIFISEDIFLVLYF